MTVWTVPRMWEDGRCFIIGGGPSVPVQFDIPAEVIAGVRSGSLDPSAYSPYMAPIHGEHVIGVNNAYMLGDWLDVCHFGDHPWYTIHRERLAQWPNLKVTHIPAFADMSLARREGVRYLARDRNKKVGLTANPGKLCWGFNTGSSAINLAVHLGVRQVILLGFDMRHEEGITHWHKGHGNVRRSYSRFLRGLPVIANDAAHMGVEVINASPDSAVDCFRKVALADIL